MSNLVQWMDKKFYPGFERNWDDLLLRERILQYINADSIILDLGAGAGIVESMNFKGRAALVCGVDLDPRVTSNPYLDEGKVSDAGKIPYEDGMFDLVFVDNVLEHLEHPLDVFNEISRVLKPGGLFLFKTPNKYHYMPVIARITPHVFHQFVNRIRGRAEVDTFPTRYLANSKNDVAHLAKETGFSVVSIGRIEGRPEYLRMTVPTYLIGLVYERLVNLSGFFDPIRILLLGVLQKK